MNIWPFNRTEKRDASYTDTLTSLLLSQATGATTASATATAASEAVSGLVARAFASAEISGPEPYTMGLTPDCMALIGRALIRTGEIVLSIDIEDGMVKLWPAADYDVNGGFNPAGWTYRVNLAGPDRYVTRAALPASGVVHLRYLVDVKRPWRGLSPIESAAIAGRLSAETSKHLGDLASGPRGSVFPWPQKDGNDPSLDLFKSDIKSLNGGLAIVESQAAGFGTPDARPGNEDNRQKHIMASPSDSLVTLNTTAFNELIAACGLSPLLFDPKAPGGSFREAYRQALFGVIQPLGRIVERELKSKIHEEISLSFESIMASDITGRARAWRSLAGPQAAMSPDIAARIVGLVINDRD